MKNLGIVLLGLLVVLVAAVFIAPGFIDWNAQKGRLSAEVRALTGRDLVVDGDVSLSLLPVPALSAAQVRFANIEGGSAPSMVELDALRVRVALLPLIQGDIQVESIDLVKPRILAEVLPDGRKNWEFAAPDAAAPGAGAAPGPASPDQSGGLAAAIRFDRITVTEGTLIYRDAPGGIEERVEDLSAELVAGSLSGPFDARGQARIRGVTADFEAKLGAFVEGGATPVSLVLGVPASDATAHFNGAVSRHGAEKSLRGRLRSEGGDLAGLIAALPLDLRLDPVFARPFRLEVEVAADPAMFEARQVALNLGEIKIDGEAKVALSPRIDAQMKFSASRIDLDALFAPNGAGATAPAPAPATSGAAVSGRQGSDQAAGRQSSGLAIPQDISADLDVSVDALVYRGQVVRQLLLSMALKDGELHLGQALALLPGGSDISLSGVVTPGAPDGSAAPRFDGRLESGSDNMRGLLDWLGVDVTDVPASRLRKMSLNTRVSASRHDIVLSDVDLRFDLSRVSGGVAVALRERLGLGIGLALDKIDLDAYLPAGPRAGGTSGAMPESGTATPADATAPQATADGLVAPAVLKDFDANFDLRVGQITVAGHDAANLHFDATLQQGSVALRELLIGDLGGAKARLVGTFTKIVEAPALDAAYDLSVPDTARLAKMFGAEAAPWAKAGKANLSGTLSGKLDALNIDASLKALNGSFGAKGALQPGAVPIKFDLALSGKHPDLAQLAKTLAPDLGLGAGLGAFDLSGKVAGTLKQFSVADLSGRLGPAALSGRLGVDLTENEPKIEGIDLTLDLQHENLGALVRALAPGSSAPNLPLALKTRVQGTNRELQLSGIDGKIGPSEVKGTMTLDRRGERPMVTAELVTGELPLAAFAAPSNKPESSDKSGAKTAAPKVSVGTAKSNSRAAARWSREPIDLAALGAFDGDLNLRAAALIGDKLRLDKANIEATLRDGVLDLRKLNGTFFDGAVLLTGQVNTRNGIDTGLALNAIEVNSAKLVKQFSDSDRVSGPLDFDVSITAKGASEADLVSSLTGSGAVKGTLSAKAKAEEELGALVLGVLGQKIREIRGVGDATNVLFGAFAGTPAAVTGTFAIDNGVAKTTDLEVKGKDATALTKGTADIALWTLDSTTEVLRAETGTTPYLTVKLAGPLDEPNVKVAGQPFQRQQQPAAQPAQPGTEPAPSQPAAPQPAKPEDIIKEGLKGLLKGLKN